MLVQVPAVLEQRDSSESLELDILRLSQRWEAQRTIRSGDTPGDALRKGPRPALAAIPPNVVAAAAQGANPFSLTAQRRKAAASRPCQQQHQQQQPSVRFAVDDAPSSAPCRQQGAAAAAAAAADAENFAEAASAAATPAAMPPATRSKAPGGATGGAATGGSPSPYVLFRGRLSFAPQADSARKFDRPTTAGKAAGAGLKRKLLISPGADISAAFPSVRKPAAKQRRRSVGDMGDARGAAGAPEEAAASPAAAAAAETAADGSGTGHYWSDPLPLPQSACRQAGAGARGALPDDDMLDTAASPASSGGAGGCCSPAGVGMDTCCQRSPAPPALSPLPGAQQHALPTVDQPDCGFPAITANTMRDLLTHGAAAFGLAAFAVVDCRYDYEFEGGHLPGALHLPTPEQVQALLGAHPEEHWQRTALIFHCEFSTERGPRAAKHVRNKDREAHMHDYPALSHPHVFVLQGGYKAFWRAHSELCVGGYRPMDHPDFGEELKACHNAVKKAWARTTRTFGRTQRARRPSYRLRQSTGAPGSSVKGLALGAAEAGAEEVEEEEVCCVPPALVAAQHAMHT